MKSWTRFQTKTGLTLVETMVASFLAVLVVGIIFAIFSGGNDLWEIKRTQADLQGQARTALDQMTAELKQTTKTGSPPLPSAASPNLRYQAIDTIDFCLPTKDINNVTVLDANGVIVWDINNRITYQYDAGQKQLIRIFGGNQNILANSVSAVQFLNSTLDNSLNSNEFKIILTISKTTPRRRTLNTTVTSTIKLRN